MLWSVAAWWTLVCSATRRPLYEVAEGSVITVPSWMPKQILLFLQQHRPFMFYCETIAMSMAYCFPDELSVRVGAAILFTLYHVTEHSETNRHGEFPILYGMWTMCLPDEEVRQACAWGIAIHFVLSAGYHKLSVGGMGGSAAARNNAGNGYEDDTTKEQSSSSSSSSSSWPYPLWMHPSTMETYLTCYRQSSKSFFSRPIFPRWNERICKSKTLCCTLSLLTLVTECFLVPGTLLLPPEQRLVGCHAMIALHIGIALVLSCKVGVVFGTTLPLYWYGFHCTSTIGSVPWMIAALLGVGPTLVSFLFGSSNGMPENWPLSPVPLFMWNGPTAQCLLQLLMTGDTRMVFATTKVASSSSSSQHQKNEESHFLSSLEGLRVLHQGETIRSSSDDDENVVHDCVMRTIGFTVVQGNEPLLEAVHALQYNQEVGGAATRALLHRTWAWLTLEKRLVEAHTGEDLTHVYFVRVDKNMRITEILL
jgi:hypothetical protein